MKKYFRVWKQLAKLATESYMSNRIEYGSYFLGKIIRFAFLFLMIFAIFGHTQVIAGYSKYQVIAFFLTTYLVDTLGQSAFRGVYLFRDDVRKGNFDYIISKPINSLFFVMSRLPDILDMIFLLPLAIFIIFTFSKLNIFQDPIYILFYLLFLILSTMIITAFHIISVSLTVWTMESESFIWVLRNATFIGLFPPEVYSGAVQVFFTIFVPVIVMFAFPVKALMGMMTFEMASVAFGIATVFFGGSLLLWNASLKSYSSASS